jgi:hypothetical protein
MSEGVFPNHAHVFLITRRWSRNNRPCLCGVILIGSVVEPEPSLRELELFALAELETVPKCIPDPVQVADPDSDPDPT